jgi:F0F1-type ATP synthase assembly protein I
MNIFKKYQKIKKRLLVAELFLLIASVFVFRGLWEILDRVEGMSTPVALWLSFIVGIIVTIICLRYLFNHDR